MRLTLIIAAALASSACYGPAPPPSAPPPEVTPRTANVSLSALPAATVAGWLGRYSSGADALTLRLSGDHLFADRGPGGSQMLSLVGLGTFADTAGTSYLITGNRLLTISAGGERREWSR